MLAGAVDEVRDHEQFVVDLPAVKAHVTKIVTQSGHCARCDKRVRSQHPEQVSTATGAARVSLGPNILGLAADLKHRYGMAYRDVAVGHAVAVLEIRGEPQDVGPERDAGCASRRRNLFRMLAAHALVAPRAVPALRNDLRDVCLHGRQVDDELFVIAHLVYGAGQHGHASSGSKNSSST